MKTYGSHREYFDELISLAARMALHPWKESSASRSRSAAYSRRSLWLAGAAADFAALSYLCVAKTFLAA
jgi:hypothetical protein